MGTLLGKLSVLAARPPALAVALPDALSSALRRHLLPAGPQAEQPLDLSAPSFVSQLAADTDHSQ